MLAIPQLLKLLVMVPRIVSHLATLDQLSSCRRKTLQVLGRGRVDQRVDPRCWVERGTTATALRQNPRTPRVEDPLLLGGTLGRAMRTWYDRVFGAARDDGDNYRTCRQARHSSMPEPASVKRKSELTGNNKPRLEKEEKRKG